MKPKYKRMLDGMAKKKAPSPSKKEKPWFLYILECCDGTFYTGITNDIQKRLEAHNRGRGARYTRIRTPVTLRYQERCISRSEDLIREYAVKALSREDKRKLFSDYRHPVRRWGG